MTIIEHRADPMQYPARPVWDRRPDRLHHAEHGLLSISSTRFAPINGNT
ncbi:MAG TPA: hypothetical protein VMG08_15165 [Allosphingosinicella sp.]|nr:hypothetical protein [Allosphingosinicella sp.]